MIGYHIFIVCSSVDGQLDCLHVLATVSRAEMHMDEPVFLSWELESFEYVFSRGIAGSHGGSISRKRHMYFHMATPASLPTSGA